ncbi:MAG TPA: DUF5615 family PIN-like protein [Terriglobales bacterium]|nr:DUF5615 family PIN-like protein [Terriglobales bacterium]
MKLLLDECVPRKLKSFVKEHECQTAREAGLAGLANGVLLDAAERLGFRALITLDRGFPYQQNLRGRQIVIAILRSRSSRVAALLTLIPSCLDAIEAAEPGTAVQIQ